MAGRIVHLNGPSSSGKSAIAREILAIAPGLWLHLGLDTFMAALPERFNGGALSHLGFDWDDSERFFRVGPVGRDMVAGMYAGVAAMAGAGLDVVLDDVVLDETWARTAHDYLSGLAVLRVGIRCPIEILEEREKARGDRHRGLARGQHNSVHEHMSYEIEFDTSKTTPHQVAESILGRLAQDL